MEEERASCTAGNGGDLCMECMDDGGFDSDGSHEEEDEDDLDLLMPSSAAEEEPEAAMKLERAMKRRTLVDRPFTRKQVEENPTVCFILMGKQVYDVTSFLSSHPGGDDMLLEYAGKDITEAFSSVHNHSQSAMSLLNRFYVGHLIDEEEGDVPSSPRGHCADATVERGDEEEPELDVVINSARSKSVSCERPATASLYSWHEKVVLSHPLTIIVFVRGSWCPFDQNYLRNWASFASVIEHKLHGQIFAVTTQEDATAGSWEKELGRPFLVTSDSNMQLVSHFNVRTSSIPSRPEYDQAGFRMCQPGTSSCVDVQGMKRLYLPLFAEELTHAALIVLSEDEEELYGWRSTPSEYNLQGAANRPRPRDVVRELLTMQKDGKNTMDETKISKSFLNKPKRDAREQRQERKDSQAELGVQLEMVEGDLIAWWRLVCVKHPIAILVYYRGDWCPFCRAWLRRWNRILPEIMLKGGVVFGISAQSQKVATHTRLDWKLDFPLIGSPHVPLQLGAFHDVYISKRFDFQYGFTQPALVVERDSVEIYKWRGIPTLLNLLGARDRPDPYDVWHLVGEQLRREEEGEVEDEKKQQKRWKKLVHIGCPLTSVGYKRRDTEGRALAKLELNDQ